MPFHVSFFWTQQGDRLGGWSENFWQGSANRQTAHNRASALFTALKRLKGNQCYCAYIRVANLDQARDSQILLNPDRAKPPTSSKDDADYQNTALLLRTRSSIGLNVTQWIKGIKDGVVTNAGSYTPAEVPGFQSAVDTFLGMLTRASNQWDQQALDPNEPAKPIEDITQIGVVTVTAHGYSSNEEVRISRARGLTVANRLWRITVLTPDTFQLQGWIQPLVTTPYTGRGTSRVQRFALQDIADAGILRATSKKSGRPFGQLSGRRKRRAT